MEEEEEPIIVNDVPVTIGEYTGQCKWFNDILGFGFLTICSGPEKGKDIFVHHSGIKPLNSNYKTLKKGEYIIFNIIEGAKGLQAIDITGIEGGPLMCDCNQLKPTIINTPWIKRAKYMRGVPSLQPPPPPPRVREPIFIDT